MVTTIPGQQLVQNINITGNILVSGLVDGRDISNDAATLLTISGAYRNASNLTGTISASVLPDTYVSQTTTNLGKYGNISLPIAFTETTGWSSLPVGYASMIRSTASGIPVVNYGYFLKVANRDTNGGWGGLWVGYNDGQNYLGRTNTSGTYATWDLLWSSANDGAGSTLDADLLDAQHGDYYRNIANLTGTTTSSLISDFTEATQDAIFTPGVIQFGTGISGTYNDGSNTYTLSGVYASTTQHGVAQFNSTDFTATGGVITLNNGGISITSSQVTDFTEASQDTIGAAIRSMNGVSGIYDDVKGTITYSGIDASTTVKGVASFSPTYFQVTGGHVQLLTEILSISELTDVSYDVKTPSDNNTILYWDNSNGYFQPSSVLEDHFASTNPHATTYGDVGAPSLASFTGHTGQTGIHFTQSQISITQSQVSDFSTYALNPANNLSDLNNIQTSRSNIKCHYYLDDLSPFDGNGVWTSTVANGGQSYQYDPRYNSNLGSSTAQGIVVVDNTTGTSSAAGAARYHNQPGCWMDNDQVYYFRIQAGQTGLAVYRVGLSNAAMTAAGDVTFGSYFEYHSSSGLFWYGCNAENSNRTKTASTASITGCINTWQWLAIEYATTGVYFYTVNDTSYNQVAYVSSNVPSVTGRSVRAFIQTVGNEGTYRALWLDKFMYKLFYSGLPYDI